MRPVNLIPPEERRGEAAPSRTGALSYVVVGVLAAAVLAATVTVLLNRSVSDKEAEVAELEQRESETAARAASLAPFAEFQQIKDTRVETVDALAESRFDWERVMIELSKVIPSRVWLTNLTGTVSPEVSVKEAANMSLRSGVSGPALELVGCAASQRDVARLIAAVGDIDGVTRVSAGKSEKPDSGAVAADQSQKATTECRTRNFITKFELLAAFDAVEVPEGAVPATPPEPTAPAPEAASTSEGTPASDGSDGGVGGAEQQEAEARDSVANAKKKVEKAKNIASGGTG
jgi:Tfp pilus assembly protein PilN